MISDDEIAEMRAEIEALRHRCDVLTAMHDVLVKSAASSLIRAGKMEEERNRARWKYGQAKKRWREREKERTDPSVGVALPKGARVIGTEYIQGMGHVVHYTTKPKSE